MATRVASRSWDRPILGLILQAIHLFLDCATFVWLSVNIWLKRLWTSNIAEDYIKLKQCSAQTLTKVPNHIALAFLEPNISMPDVAKLVVWCIASGANCISLYDIKGFLKSHQVELLSELTLITKRLPNDQFQIHWHDNNRNNNKSNGKDLSGPRSVHVCLLSQEDGRADIVQAAQRLAQQVADGNLQTKSVNESLVGSSLAANRGQPDPDVLLRFGLAHSNLGFPPWQIRLSEIHDVDTHYQVIMASAALEGYVNRLVSVITADGRNFVGTLKGFDQVINLILEDTHERIFSPNAGVEQIVLGLHIVRGDNIVCVGEIDEELDKRWDLSSVRAEPLTSIVH